MLRLRRGRRCGSILDKLSGHLNLSGMARGWKPLFGTDVPVGRRTTYSRAQSLATSPEPAPFTQSCNRLIAAARSHYSRVADSPLISLPDQPRGENAYPHAGVLTRLFRKFRERSKFLAVKFEYIEIGSRIDFVACHKSALYNPRNDSIWRRKCLTTGMTAVQE